MQDRLNSVFEQCRCENRAALIIYVTAGCPDFNASEALIDAAIDAGADIIELGVPFSDPMADGTVIQKASQTALANGANFRKVLELGGRIRRKHPQTGLILFSYYNVLLNYGLNAFGDTMEALDLDGVLAVDVPYEESDELEQICRKHAKHRIPLISPASGLYRMRLIAQEASGFIYYVTIKGTTGLRRELPSDAISKLETLKSVACNCPVVAGFGIASGEAAHRFSSAADGVVSGSGVMQFMLDTKFPIEQRIKNAAAFVKELANGVRRTE